MKKIFIILIISIFCFNKVLADNNTEAAQKLVDALKKNDKKNIEKKPEGWEPFVKNKNSILFYNPKFMSKKGNIYSMALINNVLEPLPSNKGEKSSRITLRINCDLKKIDLIKIRDFENKFASGRVLETYKSPKVEWISFGPKEMLGLVIKTTCS